VVVVEPAQIDEAGEGRGLRELNVALTRPTKTLVVVHSRPLPEPLTAQSAATQSRAERGSARSGD